MKHFIILAAIFLFISCHNSQQKDSDKQPEWYENGTLHKASVSEWKQATEENKLATSADFAASIKTSRKEKYSNMEEMRYDAENLKSCIEEAIKGDIINESKVSEVAPLCAILINNK